MPVVEVETLDGDTVKVHSEQGFSCTDMMAKMYPAQDLKLRFQWMKEIEVRDDDIMICAFPKTGTHWLWEVVSMLSKEHAKYEKHAKEVAMIEFLTKEQVASLPSPRVLNTHHTPPTLPEGFLDRKCKIIHMMRNPKDTCVSYFHHIMAFRDCYDFSRDLTFSKYVSVFTSEGLLAVPCSYMWYIKQFEQFQKENPDYPIVNVFYEDMKKQPQMEIKKLAKFLGKHTSDELISEIAEKCQFDNLKKENNENKDDPTKSYSKDGTSPMYRKGQVGDWKNHFTVADNELFDTWVKDQLEHSDITFEYE